MTSRRIVLGLGLAACLVVALGFLIEGRRTTDPSPLAHAEADRVGDSTLSPAPLETAGEVSAPRREEPAARAVGLPALHVPDYGPDLARPTAHAVFELRDARSQPLEAAVLGGVELWREVSGQWVRHPVALDFATSRAVCEGPGGSGLPPGDYELDVLAGPYGSVREPFTLLRDAFLQRTITLPHARRIVRLDLQDNLGRPLARITQAPEYTYEVVPPSWPPRVADPADRFTSDSLIAVAPGTTFNFLNRSRRGWEAYYETDGGAYHVRVFAGLPARIKLDVEKQRYGRDAIVLESDFSGPEWSGYPIVLEPVPGLQEKMDAEAWVDVNPDDPGSRSLLAAPILPPPPRLDPKDVSDMLSGRIRMIVQVDTPIPVRMVSESGTPHRAGGDIVDRTLWETDDLWFMDVMLNPGGGTLPTVCGFTDDCLFEAEVPLQPLRPLPEITPEMWGKTAFDYRARLEAMPIVLDVVPTSPTLAAYARVVHVAIAGIEPAFEIERDPSGRFSVRSGLSPALAQKLAVAAHATIEFRGGDEPGFHVARDLDAAERAALVHGAIELGDGGQGLVLRVIDDQRNGIANVAATIDGRTIRSDSDGYVLDDAAGLASGKRYALLLSGPGFEDRRIDFEAQPGITDLGVVRLRSR